MLTPVHYLRLALPQLTSFNCVPCCFWCSFNSPMWIYSFLANLWTALCQDLMVYLHSPKPSSCLVILFSTSALNCAYCFIHFNGCTDIDSRKLVIVDFMYAKVLPRHFCTCWISLHIYSETLTWLLDCLTRGFFFAKLLPRHFCSRWISVHLFWNLDLMTWLSNSWAFSVVVSNETVQDGYKTSA